jgi:hypothetical protein
MEENRRLFGAKRNEAKGNWKRLHNEHYHLYSSPDIILVIKSRKIRWAGHVARMGDRRSAKSVLVRRSEGKRLVGTARGRWKDNTKNNFKTWD